MKRHLKIIYTAVTILMFVSVLTACGKQESNSPSPPTTSMQKTESNQSIDKRLPNQDKTEQNRENPYFEDGEGLVRIALENGEASISFNVECWNETYGSQSDGVYFIPDTLQDVFFPIIVISGNVMDVCVARVSSMGTYLPTDEFELPVVVLLMDDGSIEWCYADPNVTLYSYEFSSRDMYCMNTYEKLVYKFSDDFVSIKCVPDSVNSDGMRINAINSYGYSFDFHELYLEKQLFENVWMCELQEDSLYGYLTVDADDTATFSISGVEYVDWSSSDRHLIRSGMASYVTSPDDSLPLGAITFDMELATESSVDGQMLPQNITGSYMGEITFDKNGQMTLFHNDGDKLYPSSGETLVFTSCFYGSGKKAEDELQGFYAYIRVSDRTKGDWPQFEFDDVEWIYDENEPNDHRVENNDAQWLNYTVTKDVVFTVNNDGGWEPKFLDIHEFSDYVKDRSHGEYMLVSVTTAAGINF